MPVVETVSCSNSLATLPPELVWPMIELAARSQHPRKQRWIALSLSLVNRAAREIAERRIYSCVVINSITVAKLFEQSLERKEKSPVARYTKELHFNLEIGFGAVGAALWIRWSKIMTHMPRLRAITAPPALFGLNNELDMRLISVIERLYIPIPFSTFYGNNSTHSVKFELADMVCLTHLHLKIEWADPRNVALLGLEQVQSVTHILLDFPLRGLDNMGPEDLEIVPAILTASLAGPRVQRVLVRSPVRNSGHHQALLSILLQYIRDHSEKRLWIDDSTYKIEYRDFFFSSVHLVDVTSGVEPYLRGRPLHLQVDAS
ncbi:hypothetical protein BKA62DRAFT_679958 [Auriculariales sp. MPI-PUGE-AT-0066]|nr:hypothetical protein BKA62DRAFT_679958 [Auriculariales sp. MPI-PUGE-AT-0066]